MKTITIEELEALKDAEKTIVDIRPQNQYMRGTFPGAVSLPASRLEEQYEEETARLDKMHPVYVMCHTGEKSQEWVRRLTGDGFDAVNVEGGYRAWLRLSLSRFVGGESEADREEKRARIEQSIIKKFRKPIWRARMMLRATMSSSEAPEMPFIPSRTDHFPSFMTPSAASVFSSQWSRIGRLKDFAYSTTWRMSEWS